MIHIHKSLKPEDIPLSLRVPKRAYQDPKKEFLAFRRYVATHLLKTIIQDIVTGII